MGQVFTKVMGPPLVEDPQDVLVRRRGVVWNVDGTMKSCLFCDYASGTGEETTKLLYEDDLVVAFEPVKTAAKQHFLVIPRQHITTVGDLFVSDVHVLNRMRSVAEDLLKKDAEGLAAESMQFSFHVPPWNSIGEKILSLLMSTDSQLTGCRNELIVSEELQCTHPSSWVTGTRVACCEE